MRLLHILIVTIARGASAFAQGGGPQKPNIVFILADDLGYGDVGCYKKQPSKIPTPNIDHIAAEGIRFTDAHSPSSVCSPTRYALLTGRYAWRSKLQRGVVVPWGAPGSTPARAKPRLQGAKATPQ
jgi:arylsulfatase A-like enzyme